MDGLIDQARLAHACLPDHGHYLAMPRPGPLQRLLQCRKLRLPPHERSEAPRRCGLQTPPDCTGPDQLKDLHRLWQPFDRKLPQGMHLHEPLDQPQRCRRQPDTARSGELLHARCQVRRLPTAE